MSERDITPKMVGIVGACLLNPLTYTHIHRTSNSPQPKIKVKIKTLINNNNNNNNKTIQWKRSEIEINDNLLEPKKILKKKKKPE